MEADKVAADYIADLWGERRREFARRYWRCLTRKRPRPTDAFCFGAERIATELERIWRDYSRWESFRED